MKIVRILSTLAGAGLLTVLTLSFTLSAQEPAADQAQPNPSPEPAAAPADDAEMRELGADVEPSEPEASASATSDFVQGLKDGLELEPAAEPEPEAEPEMRELGTEVDVPVTPEPPVPSAAPEVEEIIEEIVEAIAEEVSPEIAAEIEKSMHQEAKESSEDHGDGEHVGEFVQFGGNAVLEKGRTANEVVAILGNTVIEGKARGETVAVLGNVTVNGEVRREAVAVLGDVTINGRVGGEVVAVLGNVQLGPEAQVDGEIVSVGGEIIRAPGAVVKGTTNQVPFMSPELTEGLKAWVYECLLKGRPLAIGENLGWLWTVMLVALGCYAFLALILPSVVTRSAETMEEYPGMSLLSAVLTVLITPIAMIVLSVTVVGPLILGLMLFCVGIFGKVVFLAWLGRRITEPAGWKFPAVAVLIGGVITLAIYLIPFVGFIFQKFSGFLGTGIVVYTIIRAMQDNSPPPAPAGATPSGGSVPPPTPTTPVADAPSGAAMGAAAAGGSVMSDAAAAPSAAEAVPPLSETAGATASTPPPVAPPPPMAPAGLPTQLSTLPRVGFWARFAATFIDVIALGVVVGILGIGDYFLLVATAYFIVMWGLKGTTLGGVVLGIKLVRVDDRPVDWSVALVRALGAFLSLCVVGLGFIWVAWDAQRQSWHDKIAGTTLVKMPKGVSLI